MSTATHKHRTAFALALRTVSPSLSALHASRLRLIPADERMLALDPDRQAPPITTLTCVQCGHASVRMRVARSGTGKAKGRQKTRKTMHRNKDQDKAQRREDSKKDIEHNARKEMPVRVLERTCTTCTFVEHIPVPRGAAALFKSSSSSSVLKARGVARSRSGETGIGGKMSRAGDAGSGGGGGSSLVLSDFSDATFRPVTAPAGAQFPLHTPPQTPPIKSSTPVPDPLAKKRLKKKPGLQELLERNRQRQDAAARGKAPGGLSSFLDGL